MVTPVPLNPKHRMSIKAGNMLEQAMAMVPECGMQATRKCKKLKAVNEPGFRAVAISTQERALKKAAQVLYEDQQKVTYNSDPWLSVFCR